MYARSVSPAEKRYKNQRRPRCNPSRNGPGPVCESTQEDLTLEGGQEERENLEDRVKEEDAYGPRTLKGGGASLATSRWDSDVMHANRRLPRPDR